jgi:hypothetical protein
MTVGNLIGILLPMDHDLPVTVNHCENDGSATFLSDAQSCTIKVEDEWDGARLVPRIVVAIE